MSAFHEHYFCRSFQDAHVYYNSTIIKEPERLSEFWVDLDKMGPDKVLKHEMLSRSYRKAAVSFIDWYEVSNTICHFFCLICSYSLSDGYPFI